ncbi:hypothetical protein V9L05_03620 [Bernardetia sp. Wsw4-3y2]|uniref:hypothetical protein n=1 Tax=unclassified Bernardetia TaxID=2647129 RepID=UPI0030D60A6A
MYNDIPKELDVVLLTHPRDEEDVVRLLPWANKISLEEKAELLGCMRPVFGEVIRTNNLNVGILFIPSLAEKIINPVTRSKVRLLIESEVVRMLIVSQTKIVCLGGLTASLLGYGRHLKKALKDYPIQITTGHALTSISIYKTYKKVIDELGVDMQNEGISLLGVGSVGTAFARLLINKEKKLNYLLLIDKPSKETELINLKKELELITNIPVLLETTNNDGTIKEDSIIYESKVLISAVSSKDVIQIADIPANRILIDDSQPYCWNREEAWGRVIEKNDIVPCEAGLIDCSTIGYLSDFPFDFANHDENGTTTSWCCMAEGLLKHLDNSLPSILGIPSSEQINVYYNAFERFNLSAATLQCKGNILPIGKLKENFTEEKKEIHFTNLGLSKNIC